MHEAIEPIAFDYVKFIIVRAGSALLFSPDSPMSQVF